MAKPLIIENGQRFNNLTVLKEVEKSKNRRQFLCKCDCGKIGTYKLILLTTEQTKSCGCLRKNTFVERNTFHGKSRTKLNSVWQAMKQRCYNSNNLNFPYYGGRGISVCDEWKNSMIDFYNWAINNGYKEGLSIERKNVDGNYEPSNCVWVEMKVQSRNKTANVFIEFNGENLCMQDWADKIGINVSTLNKRLKNWSLEKALTTPKSEKNDTSCFRNG